MKITNFLLLSFILLLSGCSSSGNTKNDGNASIVRAGYDKWSKPPIQGGDVPETGTDLAVIVKNWPEGATPSYIVHEGWKSLGASISDTTDVGMTINARVIKASSVLHQTSKRVDESDRLVYVDKKGQTQTLKIEKWSRIEDSTPDSTE